MQAGVFLYGNLRRVAHICAPFALHVHARVHAQIQFFPRGGSAVDFGDAHFIFCQSARFIGAHVVAPAQRFHRFELAYNHVLFAHALNAHRHYYGDDGGQPLGNGGDGYRDGGHKILRYTLPPRNEREHENYHRYGEHETRYKFSQFV